MKANQGIEEILQLMVHSTCNIYGYRVLDELKTTQIILPQLHGLIFLISNKESFICTIPQEERDVAPW